MEESKNTPAEETQEVATPQTNQSSNVSFPTVGQPTKSNGGKPFLVIGILILVGILGFVVYKSASKSSQTLPDPTPFENIANNSTQTPTPIPVSSSTPKPADKSKVVVEVQNGTGITGEAAFLQNQLKAMGYTDIKVGNATSQDSTATEVTFSKTVSSGVVDEITAKLKTLYQTVTVKTATTSVTDVLVVTGLRKGATPKASGVATATPKASATPKPSTTPTATPSGL